ncbi:tumor necrosis factor ligand superfamily member 6-like [Seriola dumerili]|uniref:CD40 ligand n=1 Tax=Seriola dumerili TaxID=41447 RepID=A0A3B4T313_SERDU|nr:tumor necrosis factor ligand superfamily member 6-like [Seriola dumerili]
MINTYQTSLAPPPVPPRLNRSHPVLIPTPLPSPGHSKPLIRFLVGVVVLHLLLSVGGFIYLYYNDKMQRPPSAEGQAAFSSSEEQRSAYKALAGMVVDSQAPKISSAGYLMWDMDHSIRRNINYYHKSWLTILQSGEYYVYSTVTFTKSDLMVPLASRVKLRKDEKGEEKTVMQASCSLHREKTSIPHLCTATHGRVVTLEKGDQLSVWVQNLSLVDYDDIATTFGMYKL